MTTTTAPFVTAFFAKERVLARGRFSCVSFGLWNESLEILAIRMYDSESRELARPSAK